MASGRVECRGIVSCGLRFDVDLDVGFDVGFGFGDIGLDTGIDLGCEVRTLLCLPPEVQNHLPSLPPHRS